jgi:hypothetical protein
MSGDQDRAARHLPREETGHRMTLEHKYLAVALGLLAIAVAIQRREGPPAGRSGIARLD